MSITEPVTGASFFLSRSAARLKTHTVLVISWLWTWRRNRQAIKNICEMEDWQLYDIGLQRSDLNDSATSRFFDNGTSHLVNITRNRGKRI